MKTRFLPPLVATVFLIAAPAIAGMDHHHMGSMGGGSMGGGSMGGEAAQAPATVEVHLTEGTVKKVDKSAGKVTLTHGPLTNLGMPAMTMAFKVKDPAWLEQMKPGDKISFLVEQVGGAYTVVRFVPAK